MRKPNATGVNAPRYKHGHSGSAGKHQQTPEYMAWAAMKRKHERITHPARWDDFLVFLADVGPRPPGTRFLRKDKRLPYSLANCLWGLKPEKRAKSLQPYSKNYAGKRFHNLTAIAEVARKDGRVLWACFCHACQKHRVVTTKYFAPSYEGRSCGCDVRNRRKFESKLKPQFKRSPRERNNTGASI